MEKSTKIIAMLLASIVAVFVVVVGVTTAMMNKDEGGSDITVSQTQAPTVSVNAGQTAAPTESTSAVTTAQTNLNELILGKWTDSANMSGYEFFADGTVAMTYVNLTIPIINIPINGESTGTYVLEGDRLTTKFSIYSATIENTYTVSVENNSLSMKNHEDGDTATYGKDFSSSVSGTTNNASGEGISLVDEIVGAWVNDNGSVRYKFSDDSTVKVSFNKANVSSISTEVLNGEYTGVYLTDEASIIIQFTVGNKKVTQKFDFAVSKNTLSFTDDTGNTDLYIREGTGFVSVGEGELLGKWTDGAGMSGYEFKEGGVVEVTYVNFTVPVVNIPINGTFTGSYTVSGDSITISYSIYGSSIVDTFEYSITSNTLSLISTDGNVSTYIRK